MAAISRDEYKELVKERRTDYFVSPYELVYDCFIKMGYNRQDEDFFKEHASEVVDSLRKECWNTFVPIEQSFTSEMLCELIDENQVKGMSPKDAIVWFARQYPEYIYDLSLSNTQSRRSRAGKEFEAIIELIMIGAGLPLDSQGNVGKQYFTSRGLGKMVDIVSPGVVEYMADKNEVALISAKTTLRERWQEVPEEVSRTGAREMYLVTLDENISGDVLDTLYDANIRVTTTKEIRERCYPENIRVLDFERLIEICIGYSGAWDEYNYSEEQRAQKQEAINRQMEKHRDHKYVVQYYDMQLADISK